MVSFLESNQCSLTMASSCRLIPDTALVERNFNHNHKSNVLEYKTSENYNEGIRMKLDHVLDFVMKVDVLLNGNSSLTVVLQNRETKDAYFLHYITSDVFITTQVSFHHFSMI